MTTVGDIAQCMPLMLNHDRPDLYLHMLTARRHAFLSAALNQFDT